MNTFSINIYQNNIYIGQAIGDSSEATAEEFQHELFRRYNSSKEMDHTFNCKEGIVIVDPATGPIVLKVEML